MKREEKQGVTLTAKEFAKALRMEILVDVGDLTFTSAAVNRPGLLLTGYEEYFAASRVQVFGKREVNYLNSLSEEERCARLDIVFSQKFPCSVISRGQKVGEEYLHYAEKHGVSLFRTTRITADIVRTLSDYLNNLLADTDSVHGTLLDMFGTGVLIKGRSGIGKSELAVELVHRGHCLVSDDMVELKRVGETVYGKSPAVTQYMTEIRGVGIIDVRAIYGAGAVLNEKEVELVLELENWDDEKEYDRVGNMQLKESILDVKIPKMVIPVMPGRNLAVVAEVAARAFTLKQAGFDPLDELKKRMGQNE